MRRHILLRRTSSKTVRRAGTRHGAPTTSSRSRLHPGECSPRFPVQSFLPLARSVKVQAKDGPNVTHSRCLCMLLREGQTDVRAPQRAAPRCGHVSLLVDLTRLDFIGRALSFLIALFHRASDASILPMSPRFSHLLLPHVEAVSER